MKQLIHTDCGVTAFERHIGKIEEVEQQWYAYALKLKHQLSGQRTPSVTLTLNSNTAPGQ